MMIVALTVNGAGVEKKVTPLEDVSRSNTLSVLRRRLDG